MCKVKRMMTSIRKKFLLGDRLDLETPLTSDCHKSVRSLVQYPRGTKIARVTFGVIQNLSCPRRLKVCLLYY